MAALAIVVHAARRVLRDRRTDDVAEAVTGIVIGDELPEVRGTYGAFSCAKTPAGEGRLGEPERLSVLRRCGRPAPLGVVRRGSGTQHHRRDDGRSPRGRLALERAA